MCSPTVCSTPGARKKPCFWGRTPCARSCAAWCQRPSLFHGHGYPIWRSPGTENCRGCPSAAPWCRSPPKMSIALPIRCAATGAGAAVVLGALSPRTRNAQVAMFENGEVDYMVATDAVGMGLNLNVDHLAFAARAKFDGFVQRELLAHEIAQIAGRAGRYLRDGTFGATLDCAEFDAAMVENVEGHRFKDIRLVYWRNADLDFSSAPALLNSLAAPPPERWRKLLLRPKRAVDQDAFAALAGTRQLAGSEAVRLLWEVCQIPDFRKTMDEAHTRLLGKIFGFLSARGHIAGDWLANQITRQDRVDGDIDMLAARIARPHLDLCLPPRRLGPGSDPLARPRPRRGRSLVRRPPRSSHPKVRGPPQRHPGALARHRRGRPGHGDQGRLSRSRRRSDRSFAGVQVCSRLRGRPNRRPAFAHGRPTHDAHGNRDPGKTAAVSRSHSSYTGPARTHSMARLPGGPPYPGPGGHRPAPGIEPKRTVGGSSQSRG